jgi:Reverse transcriptase (RNA-dependent DNA polymerase)
MTYSSFTFDEDGMHLTKMQLAQRWQVTDLGEPSKIIGIEITCEYNTISISQKKYIEHLLHKEGMEHANPVVTPLDHAIPILPNPDQNEDNRSNPFACKLGELQYIANATRPDISFAVNHLASHTANPSM